MRKTIFINNKKISKKEAIKIYGKEIIEKRIKEAVESYYHDPLTICSWMDGMEIKITE